MHFVGVRRLDESRAGSGVLFGPFLELGPSSKSLVHLTLAFSPCSISLLLYSCSQRAI